MKQLKQGLTKEKWNYLLDVARFTSPASTWIKAKQIMNIYTGELFSGHVSLYEDRIAYIGTKEPMINKETTIIDAGESILAPGYIEPHSHPFQIYNPVTFTDYALTHGTTTMIHDNLYFYLSIPVNAFYNLIHDLDNHPVKNYWWARLDPQTNNPEKDDLFSPTAIKKLLEHPQILQAGELTDWKPILDGELDFRDRMYMARMSGKRVEGHNPGASWETLGAMAVAGVTCCHESITTEEALRRLRLGLYASLRYSSIRQDLPSLLRGIMEASKQISIPWNRLLMTTDGSPPFFLGQGVTDCLLSIALEAGVPWIEAYRMVTLNPAVYYGLEQEIGSIAPGRIADIVFLESVESPTPRSVMANGEFVVKDRSLQSTSPIKSWESYGCIPWPEKEWAVKPEWFDILWDNTKFPVAKMRNAVILQQIQAVLPICNGRIHLGSEQNNLLYVSLIDRNGKWVSNGILEGFARVDALASSYTISGDLLVIGIDPLQMAKAANHVLALGGGICLYQNKECEFELPLPLLGGMSDKPMEELIPLTQQFVDHLRNSGYCHEDPIYSIFFLTATHLPYLRWTYKGVVDLKSNQVLIPSRKIEW